MGRNNDYTIGNLFHEYFSKYYKLIAIDLSKKTEKKQQIIFIERLDEDNAAMFFIFEKPEETTFDCSIYKMET